MPRASACFSLRWTSGAEPASEDLAEDKGTCQPASRRRRRGPLDFCPWLPFSKARASRGGHGFCGVAFMDALLLFPFWELPSSPPRAVQRQFIVVSPFMVLAELGAVYCTSAFQTGIES